MTRQIYRLGFLMFLTGAAGVAQQSPETWFQQAQSDWFQSPKASNLPDPSVQPFGGNNQVWRTLKGFNGAPGPKGSMQGRWWSNPQTAEALGLTADQVKKMDDIFQQHRLKLIDLNASLEKEEAILEPLVGAEQPDDNKVVAQIDRVAQARAELEKANSRMLWSVRRVLTPEQWKKLQTYPPKPRKY
jgi:Spy/CpxP family protein refolding chaperone